MKRWLLLGLFAAIMPAGCDYVVPRTTRPVSVEMSTPEGNWRLEGVQKATLDLVGWQIRIVKSKVNVSSSVPLLEKLVLEIENTAPNLPLVVEPGEVALSGVADRAAVLGPAERVVLNQNDALILEYTPGVRAELLLYPFSLRVVVYRGPNRQDRQEAVLKFY